MALFSTLNAFLASGVNGGLPLTGISTSVGGDIDLTAGQLGSIDQQKFAISIWARPGIVTGLDYGFNDSFLITYGVNSLLDIGTRTYGVRFTCRNGSLTNSITSNNLFIIDNGYVHGLFIWDGAQLNVSDRAQMYLNGNLITSFASENRDDFTTVASPTGARILGQGLGSGGTPSPSLSYQPAFFNGVIPSIGDVYNAGLKVDLSNESGIKSLINNSTGLGYDYKLNTSWTNDHGTVTTTLIIPA